MAQTAAPSPFVPLYQQVKNDLMADVDAGVLECGSRIPTEAALCERFGVSRITVRRALDELVADGYLERRRGCGTFVRRPSVLRIIQRDNNDTGTFSFSEACRACGYRPGAQTLSRRRVKAPISCQALFGLSPSADVLRVVRLRTADATPILIEVNFYHGDRFDFLLDEDLDDTSIDLLVRERTGLRQVLHRSCSLEMVAASVEMASVLDVTAGEPLFRLMGDYYDTYGEPMLRGERYIVGSRYSFAV